jgi:hypothetical protein
VQKCKCGQSADNTARYCEKCGQQFPNAVTKFALWCLVLVSGLVVLGVITAALSVLSDDSGHKLVNRQTPPPQAEPTARAMFFRGYLSPWPDEPANLTIDGVLVHKLGTNHEWSCNISRGAHTINGRAFFLESGRWYRFGIAPWTQRHDFYVYQTWGFPEPNDLPIGAPRWMPEGLVHDHE